MAIVAEIKPCILQTLEAELLWLIQQFILMTLVAKRIIFLLTTRYLLILTTNPRFRANTLQELKIIISFRAQEFLIYLLCGLLLSLDLQ